MVLNKPLEAQLAPKQALEATAGSKCFNPFNLNGSLMLLAGVPISVEMLGQWAHFDNLGSLALKLLTLHAKRLTFD